MSATTHDHPAIAPHHLAELKASGLSPEMIAMAGVYSVPATFDILGFETGPGLVYPYFGCNGYARVKVDQADADGRRYRSPKDQGNHLYIPPLLAAGKPGPYGIAGVPGISLVPSKGVLQASAPLWITEGEKKTLKANEVGCSCLGLSGVWSWRMKNEAGKSIPLPDLDLVLWKGRTVYLAFDADAATNPDVLRAESGLATELRQRGARVIVVRLPGPEKGLDDYLMVHPVADLITLTRTFHLQPNIDRITGQVTSPWVAFADWKEVLFWSDVSAAHPDGVDSAKMKPLHKKIKALLRDEFADQNPELVVSGDFAQESDAAWEALRRNNARDAGPFTFLYGNALVDVVRGAIKESSVGSLTDLLSRVAQWRRADKAGELRKTYPVDRIVALMLKDPHAPMPTLHSLTHVPVFPSDGRLIQARGYDEHSGIYYAPGSFTVPPVPEHPTPADVDTAKTWILEDLLGGFRFANDGSRATAVALFLGFAARNFIAGATPLHVIEKPVRGTGGSLLVRSITTVALGHEAPGFTEKETEDETRKQITSSLLTSPAYMLLENVNRVVKGSAISQAISSLIWQDRILGANRNATLPVRCLWVAVGNNPDFSDEVGDRVVSCRIEPPAEYADRPRDVPPSFYTHNLDTWVPAHRSELVWAGLVLIQHWVAQGSPRAKELTFGSFQEWAEVMGGILKTAGINGLLSNRKEFLGRISDEADVDALFVRLWWREYAKVERDATTYASNLIALADQAGTRTIDSSKKGKDGRPDKSVQIKMGYHLKRLLGRTFTVDDDVKVKVSRPDPWQDEIGSKWCLRSAGNGGISGVSGIPGMRSALPVPEEEHLF